jgi:hypothetical protein
MKMSQKRQVFGLKSVDTSATLDYVQHTEFHRRG